MAAQSGQMTQRVARDRIDLDVAQLWYLGDRNPVAGYLQRAGWHRRHPPCPRFSPNTAASSPAGRPRGTRSSSPRVAAAAAAQDDGSGVPAVVGSGPAGPTAPSTSFLSNVHSGRPRHSSAWVARQQLSNDSLGCSVNSCSARLTMTRSQVIWVSDIRPSLAAAAAARLGIRSRRSPRR